MTPEQQAHLKQFCEERNDWAVLVLRDLWVDEGQGDDPPTGKYPPSNPYLTGMKWTLDRVIPKAPVALLDIGSPIAQSVALAAVPGIDVTMADIRQNDDAATLGLKWTTADCLELPFLDKTFEVVTCNWVFAHVGDGRYGDALRVGADIALLKEIARLTRDFAIIGLGTIGEYCANLFNVHRIYSWSWIEAAMLEAGLEIVERAELLSKNDIYFDSTFVPHREIIRMDCQYGIVKVRPT